jgi:hypothetical protein
LLIFDVDLISAKPADAGGDAEKPASKPAAKPAAKPNSPTPPKN